MLTSLGGSKILIIFLYSLKGLLEILYLEELYFFSIKKDERAKVLID